MKDWMSKIETWRLHSDHRDLERWARIRAQGQARYIVNGALTIGLFIMLMNDIIDGGFGIRIVLSAHLTGAAVAWFTWRDIESKYQRALLKAQQKATAAPTNILGLRDS
jgi:hypothetical protein